MIWKKVKTVTLFEYKNACAAASPAIANPFLNKTALQALDATLFTDTLCSMVEFCVPLERELLEMAFDADDLSLSDLHAQVIARTSAAIYPHLDEWKLHQRAINALAATTTSDLGDNFTKTRDANGRQDGGTTTDGTASRNSFNSSQLEPVSGSSVTATSGSMYSDHESESGVQGRTKALNMVDLIKSIEWKDLLQSITDAVVGAVAITVY